MPYQSSPSFSTSDDRAFETYVNESIASTQPTSNSSYLTIHTNTLIQHYQSNPHVYNHAVPTLQTPTSPTPPTFNTQYGCRSILTMNKSTCKNDLDHFKLLYCMYSGCQCTARSRIQELIDNKHSSLSIHHIKPIKKQSIEELI